MAKNNGPEWDDLNAKQRKLAMSRWRKRTGSDQETLSPEQIAAAKKKQRRQQEVAPGLTYGDLVRDTRAASQLKYGEAGRQLKAQPKRINSWFDQYQQAIADAQAAQKGATADAVQGVQNLQSGLDDASRQQWAGQQAAATADAASRGASVDPKLADVAHNASNVRNALTGSYGAMLLSQGANENSYLGKRKVNAEVGRVDSLKSNAQQRQALARERGAFKQTYRGQAISEAASNALKAALTVSTIGETKADTEETKTKTAKTAAEIAFLEKYKRYPSTAKPNSTQTQLDKAKLKYFRENGYFPPTGPPSDDSPKAGSKDDYGNTPLQQRERTSDYRKLTGDAKDTYKLATTGGKLADGTVIPAKIAPGVQPKPAQFKILFDLIKDDYPSVNIDIIRAAVQKAVYGRIGPKLKKALREQGVNF